MPMSVTIGGLKGPIKSPVCPAPWNMTAITLGVMPIADTRGMTIGAMIAFAPASVPRRATRTTEVTMVARMALFSESTPIFFMKKYTMFSATPVCLRTTPRPEPSMMISPTRERNDPIALAITEPIPSMGCWTMTAPTTTHIATFTTGCIPFLKARITYRSNGNNPKSGGNPKIMSMTSLFSGDSLQ
ncbi:hypothetical protein SDC9_150877 [bioreactor metagenome]|uniref:Uncharacterized protein n=1 Tax=bioreactor metagenome TaxID=1076179 RepID=A0A645EQC3_9ZZZZ